MLCINDIQEAIWYSDLAHLGAAITYFITDLQFSHKTHKNPYRSCHKLLLETLVTKGLRLESGKPIKLRVKWTRD